MASEIEKDVTMTAGQLEQLLDLINRVAQQNGTSPEHALAGMAIYAKLYANPPNYAVDV